MQPSDDAVQPSHHAHETSDVTGAKPRPSAVPAPIDVRLRKRRLRWVILSAGLLALAAWAGAAYYTSCPLPVNPVVWHEAEARRQVAAALPQGSTRQQVLAWLQANGIRHEEVLDPQCGVVSIGAKRPYIGWLFDRGAVFMEFNFDCAGKLTGERVRIHVISF